MPRLNAFDLLMMVLIFGQVIDYILIFSNTPTRKTGKRAPDITCCALIDICYFINCKFSAMKIYGLKILVRFFFFNT